MLLAHERQGQHRPRPVFDAPSDQVEDLSFGELSVRMAKVLLRFAELQGTISPRDRG